MLGTWDCRSMSKFLKGSATSESGIPFGAGAGVSAGCRRQGCTAKEAESAVSEVHCSMFLPFTWSPQSCLG